MGIYTNDLQLFISAKFNETLLVKILQELYCVNDVSIKSIKFNSDSKKGDSYLSTVTRLIVEANGQNTGYVCRYCTKTYNYSDSNIYLSILSF